MAAMHRTVYLMFGLFAMLSLAVNPLIYAARYDVFKRYVKQKLNKYIT